MSTTISITAASVKNAIELHGHKFLLPLLTETNGVFSAEVTLHLLIC